MKKVLIVAALALALGGCDLAPKNVVSDAGNGVIGIAYITCRWPTGDLMEIPGSGGQKIENLVPKEWDVSDYRYYKIVPGTDYKMIRAPVQNCIIGDKEVAR